MFVWFTEQSLVIAQVTCGSVGAGPESGVPLDPPASLSTPPVDDVDDVVPPVDGVVEPLLPLDVVVEPLLFGALPPLLFDVVVVPPSAGSTVSRLTIEAHAEPLAHAMTALAPTTDPQRRMS